MFPGMKMLLVVAMLSACATNPDPHAIVDCVGYTTIDGSGASHPFVGKCEFACEMPHDAPMDLTGAPCTAKTGDHCGGTFAFDQVRGCCSPYSLGATWRFTECK